MMIVIRSVLVASTLLMLGCACPKKDVWHQDRQSEWVAGQNETLEILNNTSAGNFSYDGTIVRVVEQLNLHLDEQGIDRITVLLDLDFARDFSPDPADEISEFLNRQLSGTVEYRNLQFLFYEVVKDSEFEVRFIRNHVVITPRFYTSLYSNLNRRFEPSFFLDEGSRQLFGMIGVMNLVIPDEELVIEASNCPIPENHKVDLALIEEMTFLDAIRLIENRLNAEAILTEKNKLTLRCSE